jgi:hypothetical protein
MATSGIKKGRNPSNSSGPKHQERAKKKHFKKLSDLNNGPVKRTRRKIGINDILLSRGQWEYSITEDLSLQKANITVGQLVARCLSLRRKLRAAISTKRRHIPKHTHVACTTGHDSGDYQAPRVEAVIKGNMVSGCLVDGGAAVNMMASWLLSELEMTVSQQSSMKLKGIDQRRAKPLGQLCNIPMTVNGVTVQIDFQVLDITNQKGGYPIILGRPWLRKVSATNNWKKETMVKGPSQHCVELSVSQTCPSISNERSNFNSDSSWTSNRSCSSYSDTEDEAEVYSLEVLPQVIQQGYGPNRLKLDATTLPVTHDEAKEKEILSKVQFGPTLSPSEREEMQCLVKAYMSLFVTKYVDLPTITIEEHKIELVEGARPVRCKQQRLSPQQADILKRELDQLLAGRFIEPVDNAQWISPVTIVPKKNGKWRVCVNYKALNKVTKKTDILYHL